jgi:hypothetical protein
MKYIRRRIYLSCYYRDSKAEIVSIKRNIQLSYHLFGSDIIIVLVELTIDGAINNLEIKIPSTVIKDNISKY